MEHLICRGLKIIIYDYLSLSSLHWIAIHRNHHNINLNRLTQSNEIYGSIYNDRLDNL